MGTPDAGPSALFPIVARFSMAEMAMRGNAVASPATEAIKRVWRYFILASKTCKNKKEQDEAPKYKETRRASLNKNF